MTFKALIRLAVAFLVCCQLNAAEDETPLYKEMTAMNKSLRILKRQVADPAKKDDNLALVAKMKSNVDASLKLEPAKTKDVPGADKPSYLDKYKQQLVDLKKSFEDLEAALKADKQDEAKKIFEKLADQKEKAHKDFGVCDE